MPLSTMEAVADDTDFPLAEGVGQAEVIVEVIGVLLRGDAEGGLVVADNAEDQVGGRVPAAAMIGESELLLEGGLSKDCRSRRPR